MRSPSILTIVFKETFHASPVLLYADYFRVNFAMLRVAMLKMCLKDFMFGEYSRAYARILAKFILKWLGQHCDLKDARGPTSRSILLQLCTH